MSLRPGDPGAELSRFERLLVWLGFKYLDIKKLIQNCEACGNSGFTGPHDYGGICDACAGQSAVGLETVYLRRFYLIHGKRFNLFLHHFFRSDDDPDPHNHPWWFVTWPFGSYTDERYENTVHWTKPNVRRIGPFPEKVRMLVPKFRPATHIHQVRIERPIWTLVATGPVTQDWGFVKKVDGWVHWRKYLGIDDAGYDPDHPTRPESVTKPGGA